MWKSYCLVGNTQLQYQSNTAQSVNRTLNFKKNLLDEINPLKPCYVSRRFGLMYPVTVAYTYSLFCDVIIFLFENTRSSFIFQCPSSRIRCQIQGVTFKKILGSYTFTEHFLLTRGRTVQKYLKYDFALAKYGWKTLWTQRQ